MKNLTKTISMLAVGLLSYGLFCQQAQAITGDIVFTGKAKASGASGAGTTTISFKNPWHVFAGTGDYSEIGRASCRESAYIYVGAECMKIKQRVVDNYRY